MAESHGRPIATPVPRSRVRRFRKRLAVDTDELVRLFFDVSSCIAKVLSVE
jgi:hypothetical protein